jgi:arylsulfate sulfotransferase
MRIFVMVSLAVSLLTVPQVLRAITILSGPLFTPATNAPLAGTLQLTTDVASRISVLISDGTNIWERDFYDYSTTHSVPLLGFNANKTNQIQVSVYDKDRNAYTSPQLLSFVTAPLPTNFPTINVLTSQPGMMEPGYMLFIIGGSGVTDTYITIIDNSGNVVWYSKDPPAAPADVRQIADGDLFIQEAGTANNFIEMNMLGQIVRTWLPPAGYPVNTHEGLVTSHGTIMYISDAKEVVTNFPTSDTNSNPTLKTVNVDDNPVVEISFTNSALLNHWSPLQMIDPTRVTYLTYGEYSGSSYGVDNEHANALIDDTNDSSIIVSMRDQNTVFKFSRATGQLKWILGSPALWGTNWQQCLLTPAGTPFNWNFGQHAPELTPEGTLMVYNDNNYATSPFDPPVADSNNCSSAVEYNINETNMEVSEVWNSAWQTNQDRLYTPYIGRVQWLPQTRNILVDYGAVMYVNGAHPSTHATSATMVRIKEYTHDPVPQVVFDLSFFDYTNTSPTYSGYDCYRVYQIPDLYTHPAAAVSDLTVSDVEQIPLLQFSADPTHNYLVQASTDKINWTTIGTPVEEGGVGAYVFEDLDAELFATRFYRVVTQ